MQLLWRPNVSVNVHKTVNVQLLFVNLLYKQGPLLPTEGRQLHTDWAVRQRLRLIQRLARLKL